MLRISGGELKGRKIKTLKNKSLRPTTEQVRESIFSILQNMASLENESFLDLFAGVGTVGIEAISRGASNASFVESDKYHQALIKENLENLNFSQKAKVYCMSVSNYLKKEACNLSEKFSVVFSDPPYDKIGFRDIYDLREKSKVLKENGVFIFETSRFVEIENELEECSGSLKFELKKSYGDTCLYFFKTLES